jgi:murein DD-endopeptidase MepM/ murein hydrolase activator NlpD
VGNTGNSTEPHLHFHIVDHPSFLAGQGIPYEFAHFSASDSTELIDKPQDENFFRNIGPRKPFHNDYPANNAAVNFADCGSKAFRARTSRLRTPGIGAANQN